MCGLSVEDAKLLSAFLKGTSSFTVNVDAITGDVTVSDIAGTGGQLTANVPGVYRISSEVTFTIGNGATGSAVAASDLGANYGFLEIACDDADGIAAASTINVYKGFAADALRLVLDPDTGSAYAPAVPATGTFALTLPFFCLGRYVRIVLNQNTDAGAVVLRLRGIDRAAA